MNDPEWKATKDVEDGSWEVGYTNSRGMSVMLGYGLTEEKARLIAAAPDMLAALTVAFNCLKGDSGTAFRDMHPATWRQMQAAIAKAEGCE
jgi:hypothetical protein